MKSDESVNFMLNSRWTKAAGHHPRDKGYRITFNVKFDLANGVANAPGSISHRNAQFHKKSIW